MKLNVLYEDNHLIAVYKPAGILTQGDKSKDENLMDIVKLYLKEKYNKPGNVFLGLLHRLDRPVSGIILFAKTSKGASRLSEQFRNRTIEKIYTAVVIGRLKKDKGVLLNFIEKDEKGRKAVINDQGDTVAELYYETVASNKKFSLLKIKLETGKFHQIRSQLSTAHCPILGDIKYGASFALPDQSIALCATSISFKTATNEEIKQISIPIPKEWKEYIEF